jgi:molybdate transport system substrate-binding protein
VQWVLGASVALVAVLAQAGVRPPVTVSAAASLAEVLERLAKDYEARTGEAVRLNVGASNALARQIRAGARVDLFVSADERQMDAVADAIDPPSRVPLLSNRLAIAVPDDRPRRFGSARDLADASIRRIALADPAAVPAGVYAYAYLEKIGIWDAIASKVIPCGSVRLALAAVENGAADAAIVYTTDLLTAKRARQALVVPAAEGPRIVYPAAIVRDGPNPAGGRRFLDFLRSAEARRVFAEAGFLQP